MDVDSDSDSDPDEALLLQRYGQIEQRLQSYDRTIHNSFYLSLVYIGAVVAVITPLSVPRVVIGGVPFFSGLVFVELLPWNHQAVDDRRHSNSRKPDVERILSDREYAEEIGFRVEDRS